MARFWDRPKRKFMKKSFSKKRSFSRKRKAFGSRKRRKFGGGGFASRVRAVVMKQMTADNSYLLNYADAANSVGTINQVANQLMWAWNIVTSGGVTTSTTSNLHLDDPQVLQSIATNIDSALTTKFTRKSASIECIIQNTETAPMWIWEYRCQARANQTIMPHTTLISGFSDASTGIVAKVTATDVGATPYMSPRFTSQFKIVKVKKRFLNPSKHWKITYSLKKPRAYSAESFAPAGVAYKMLRGQRFSVFCIHGTFGSNTAANSGARIGISTAAVGIVYKIRYHYSWMDDQTIATGANEHLYGFTAGATNATTAHVAHPIVTNHPDSAVATGTTNTAGDRVYDSVANTRFATGDEAVS